MELSQLKQIKILSETENINDASTILGIFQPALSMSVQKLESELGISLFDRTNRKMTLNEQGRIVLESAEKMLKLLDFMNKDIHYEKYAPKLKVASSINALLTYVIPEFNVSYRKINLYSQLRQESFLPQYLRNEIFDVVISSEDISSDDIVCEPIFKDYVFISVPEGHRLYNNKIIHLKELNNETFVQYSNYNPSPLPTLFEDLLTKAGIAYKLDLQGDLISTFEVAKRSENLLFINSIGVRFDPLSEHTRRYIPIDSAEKAYLTYYISHKASAKNKNVKIFTNWLKERMNKFPCGYLNKGGDNQ